MWEVLKGQALWTSDSEIASRIKMHSRPMNLGLFSLAMDPAKTGPELSSLVRQLLPLVHFFLRHRDKQSTARLWVKQRCVSCSLLLRQLRGLPFTLKTKHGFCLTIGGSKRAFYPLLNQIGNAGQQRHIVKLATR